MAVVVAGGTRGIGLELASALTPVGGTAVLGYAHDEAAARAAVARMADEGRTAVPVRADLTEPAGAQRLADAAAELGTPVRQVVHSAVRVVTGSLLSLTEAELTGALAVNGTSLLWLVRALRPLLRPGSTVLYLTSRGGRSVVPGYGSVGPAKALGEALVRYLAVELAPEGIRVNALAPGTQDTAALRQVFGDRTDEIIAATAARSPSGRLVTPADYTATARFLASPEASMVTGQVLFVHGGADLLG